MSQVITKTGQSIAQSVPEGVTLSGTAIQVGLPPLVSMFNSQGTAYAAGRTQPPKSPRRRSRAGSSSGSTATASRSATGSRAAPGRDFDLPPCLSPLALLPQRYSRSHWPR